MKNCQIIKSNLQGFLGFGKLRALVNFYRHSGHWHLEKRHSLDIDYVEVKFILFSYTHNAHFEYLEKAIDIKVKDIQDIDIH